MHSTLQHGGVVDGRFPKKCLERPYKIMASFLLLKRYVCDLVHMEVKENAQEQSIMVS